MVIRSAQLGAKSSFWIFTEPGFNQKMESGVEAARGSCHCLRGFKDFNPRMASARAFCQGLGELEGRSCQRMGESEGSDKDSLKTLQLEILGLPSICAV